MADLAACLEPAQVYHIDRVYDQVNDVVLRQPVHHVDRGQETLAAIRRAKKARSALG